MLCLLSASIKVIQLVVHISRLGVFHLIFPKLKRNPTQVLYFLRISAAVQQPLSFVLIWTQHYIINIMEIKSSSLNLILANHN